MVKTKYLSFMLIAFVVFLITACAASSPDGSKTVTTVLDQMMLEKAKLLEKHVVAGIGEGVATKQQMAYSKADMMARADIAKSLTAKAQERSKQFYEEAGEEEISHSMQVNEQLASEKISGASSIKMVSEITNDGKYKVTVLMALDPQIFDEFMSAQLKAAESEKVRARAAEGYKSAEAAFAAYDAAKKVR